MVAVWEVCLPLSKDVPFSHAISVTLQGYSGVSWDMLNLLKDFLNHNIVPVIPQEGSVGASGDLTPLSYVAGAMVGERESHTIKAKLKTA